MVRPLSNQSKLTNAKLKFIIPSCWLAGLLWNAPLFVAVTYREDLETCGEKWRYKLSPVAYSLGWAVVAGVIPISVMSYLYSRVVYKLWFDRTPAVASTSAVSTVGKMLPGVQMVFDYSLSSIRCTFNSINNILFTNYLVRPDYKGTNIPGCTLQSCMWGGSAVLHTL